MLPISVGILSWRSNKSIRNTLKSYKNNGFLDLVSDIKILFQEARDEDIKLAEEYNLPYIALDENIGIGRAFTRLAEEASEDYVLLLEHDWELVEKKAQVEKQLKGAIELMENGTDCVRLRHRELYGHPHYSIQRYKGKELDFFDEWIQLEHPHLLDALHWQKHPDTLWPDKIRKYKDFYQCSSRYANWTNNPCLFKKQFYLDSVRNFAGDGIDLEKNISYWWARQNFTVAQGLGLFKHKDIDKYQPFFLKKIFSKQY